MYPAWTVSLRIASDRLQKLEYFTSFIESYQKLEADNAKLQALADKSVEFQASLAEACKRETNLQHKLEHESRERVHATDQRVKGRAMLDSAQEQVGHLEQEVRSWSAEVDLLRTEKDDSRDVVATLETETEALQQQISIHQAQALDLQGQISTLNTTVTRLQPLEVDNRDLKARIEVLEKEVKDTSKKHEDYKKRVRCLGNEH